MWLDKQKTKYLLYLIALICLSFAARDLHAQEKAHQGPPSSDKQKLVGEQVSTQIGDSGYKVTIPEINLRSIVGGKSKEQIIPETRQSNQQESDQAKSEKQTVQKATEKIVDRLPFDPVDAGQPSSVLVPYSAPAPSSSIETTKKQTEPSGQDRVTATPTVEDTSSPPPTEDANPVYQPPVAPEEILDASFVPKKEVLRSADTLKQHSVAMLEPKVFRANRLEVATTPGKEPLSREEWLPLNSRKAPLLVELPPTKKEEVQEGLQDLVQDRHSPSESGEASAGQKPETPIASLPKDLHDEAPPLEKPVQETTQPEQPSTTESVEKQAKEKMLTPLDEDALDSREARDYLRETAPILEELSLLMTRAPGLTIEDYDPSDTNSPLVPNDIRVKITSLKRELQVLDSKTFAIIPPARYQPFHSLVRESIAHAYQACDAIINYFEENNPDNFVKAREHLVKAGELIRKTVKQNDRSL